MPNLASCAECRENGRLNQVDINLGQLGPGIELRGVLTCSKDENKWPITMVENRFVEISNALPSSDSKKLRQNVPPGIKEDVREAEQIHFAQSYKAAVVMCRRALQLGLEDRLRRKKDRMTLGPLLGEERKRKAPLFTDQTYQLVQRVKKYGDGGAHAEVDIDPKTVEVVIHDTVVALNELYPVKKARRKPPASQSGTGSSAT